MPSGSGRGAAGYMLVVLVMWITLLEVAVAAVLPLWSSTIRRDREEEAISRGLQYAEAIRVFQRRFGRLPNRLEELIEIEPRSIRRLWKDPLTTDGAWAVIVQTPQGGSIAIDPETGLPLVPPVPAPGADGDLAPPEGKPPALGPPGGPGASPPGTTPQPISGPIRGVKTRATGDAFQTIFDQSSYDGWEFTIDLLIKATSRPGGAGIPRWNALTLGRPFRYPPPGELPGGTVMPAIGMRPGPAPKPTATPPPGTPRPRSIPAPRRGNG